MPLINKLCACCWLLAAGLPGVYVCMYVYMYVCMYVCMYVPVCIPVYVVDRLSLWV